MSTWVANDACPKPSEQALYCRINLTCCVCVGVAAVALTENCAICILRPYWPLRRGVLYLFPCILDFSCGYNRQLPDACSIHVIMHSQTAVQYKLLQLLITVWVLIYSIQALNNERSSALQTAVL